MTLASQEQKVKLKYGASDQIKDITINFPNGGGMSLRDRLEYRNREGTKYPLKEFDEAWVDWDGFTYSILYRNKGKTRERIDYPHTSVLSVRVEFEE